MHGPAAPELVLPLELLEPELVFPLEPLELVLPLEPPAPAPFDPDPQALMTMRTPRIPSPGTAARRMGTSARRARRASTGKESMSRRIGVRGKGAEHAARTLRADGLR